MSLVRENTEKNSRIISLITVDGTITNYRKSSNSDLHVVYGRYYIF